MKAIIIGAGLSGLMAAKILAEQDIEVEVLERENTCGGLAKSADMNGYTIPIFYHHIFSHDSATLGVIKELGMENQLIWKKIKMGITFGDVIHGISPLSTLSWNFISLRDKLRLGKLYLSAKFKKNWSDVEGIDAKTWLEKTVGSNIADKIFKNIMIEKYGLPLERVSASELAERLANEEATGNFAYPRNGLHKMIDGLISSIESAGGNVITGAKIRKISIRNNRVQNVIVKNKTKSKTLQSDIVINTAPLPEFLKIAHGLPKDYAARLAKIKYCKNICVDVGLEEHLSDYYWVNCFGQDIGGIIEHTNIADIYPFKFAWVFKYAPPEQLWALGDSAVSKVFVNAMKNIFPDARPLWTKVFRSEYASPIYDIDYAKFMPDYTTPVKGLFMSGIALTYPKIRNMNMAFLSGIKTANIVLSNSGNSDIDSEPSEETGEC